MFKWTPDMQIDNGQIDEDHQRLIAIANRVIELNHPAHDTEELKQVIRNLYDYVKDHFNREEQFMHKLGYPEVDVHQEKHAIIIADMNQYLTKSHHMGELLSKFRQLVNKWVINHIMEEDKKTHHFIKAQNKE